MKKPKTKTPPSLKIIAPNGKSVTVPLSPDGKSRGQHDKLRAATGIPGFGRIFVNVYREENTAHRVPKKTAAAPAPSPPVVLAVESLKPDTGEALVRLLAAMTQRLERLETRTGALAHVPATGASAHH